MNKTAGDVGELGSGLMELKNESCGQWRVNKEIEVFK